MKAKINGIEVEGTPEEIVAFYNEISKRNAAEPNKTYTVHPSIRRFSSFLMPQIHCHN